MVETIETLKENHKGTSVSDIEVAFKNVFWIVSNVKISMIKGIRLLNDIFEV